MAPLQITLDSGDLWWLALLGLLWAFFGGFGSQAGKDFAQWRAERRRARRRT